MWVVMRDFKVFTTPRWLLEGYDNKAGGDSSGYKGYSTFKNRVEAMRHYQQSPPSTIHLHTYFDGSY